MLAKFMNVLYYTQKAEIVSSLNFVFRLHF